MKSETARIFSLEGLCGERERLLGIGCFFMKH
jgi:hypothetical protein